MIGGFDPTEKRIQSALQNVGARFPNPGDSKAADWTLGIKRELRHLANQLGLVCYSSDNPDPAYREWLWDVAWTKRSSGGAPTNDPGDLLDLELALESEWQSGPFANGEVSRPLKYDFEKLGIARAHHRVFIFQKANRDAAEGAISKLWDLVMNLKFRQDGDRYMFACWVFDTKQFVFNLLTV